MTLALAKTFQAISYPQKGLRYVIADWHRHDPSRLTANERYHRVRAIQDFILDESAHIKSVSERRDYIDKTFPTQIALGVKYLETLRYSDEMLDIFNTIQKNMIAEMAKGIGHIDTEKSVSREQWKSIFENFTKLFFDVAGREFNVDFKSAELDTTKTHELGRAWISSPYNTLQSGDFGAVFIGEKNFYRQAGSIVNDVCHEGTHHTMVQWARMVSLNEIEVSDELQNDAELIILNFQIGASANSLIYDMYRADPFENIAFDTGDGVERGFYMLKDIIDHIPEENRSHPDLFQRILRTLQPL